MKSKIIYTLGLLTLTLTACSTTPTNLNAPIVLEQHKNIAVEPETKHNLARLIKQKNNCVIEFTGNFETGKATEYWLFKGDQVISAFSNIQTQVKTKQTVFDPNKAEKIANFQSLIKNFKSSNLEQCS